jgi:hypothetical protein
VDRNRKRRFGEEVRLIGLLLDLRGFESPSSTTIDINLIGKV